MNLDNIKTKGVVDESKFIDLSNSIAESIIDMKFISKENISALVKAQFKIFYEKQHIAKLGLKIKQLEDNAVKLKAETKLHKNLMSLEANYFHNKYKSVVNESEMLKCYEELKEVREKIKEKANEQKPLG